MSSGERKRIEAKPVARDSRQALRGRGRGNVVAGSAVLAGSEKDVVLVERIWKNRP